MTDPNVDPRLSLMSPLTLGDLALRNRIVMSPMTRGRSPGGTPCALNAEYYGSRADAGLIFAESTAISARGRGYGDNPCIITDAHADAWRQVTDAVHARAGLIFLQLWHVGHNSHPLLQEDGGLPVGPSAVPVRGLARTPQGPMPLVVPREIAINEMPALVDEYRQAARRAQRAGFDGVEVHAGNGYLLDQFLRDSTNVRTDAYGGSPENRRRLLLEVVEAVAEIWPRNRISVRISPVNPAQFEITDSNPEKTFGCVAEGVQQAGIGFLHVVEGATRSLAPGAMSHADQQCAFDFGQLRARFKGAYIANNNYDFATAERAIADGHADLVSFGRPFLANPDLVIRYKMGVPLNQIDRTTMYSRGATGYTDYPLISEL